MHDTATMQCHMKWTPCNAAMMNITVDAAAPTKAIQPCRIFPLTIPARAPKNATSGEVHSSAPNASTTVLAYQLCWHPDISTLVDECPPLPLQTPLKRCSTCHEYGHASDMLFCQCFQVANLAVKTVDMQVETATRFSCSRASPWLQPPARSRIAPRYAAWLQIWVRACSPVSKLGGRSAAA
jgi:hypothetical protein